MHCRAPVLAPLIWAGVLAATACAGPAQRERQAAARLIGGPDAAVVAAYGEPHRRTAISEGSRLEYEFASERLVPGREGPPSIGVTRSGQLTYQRGLPSAPMLEPWRCQLEFEVDAQGIVTAWRAAGNACFEVLDSPQLWR